MAVTRIRTDSEVHFAVSEEQILPQVTTNKGRVSLLKPDRVTVLLHDGVIFEAVVRGPARVEPREADAYVAYTAVQFTPNGGYLKASFAAAPKWLQTLIDSFQEKEVPQ